MVVGCSYGPCLRHILYACIFVYNVHEHEIHMEPNLEFKEVYYRNLYS